MNDDQLILPPYSEASHAVVQTVLQAQHRGDRKQASRLAIQALANYPQCAAIYYLNYQLAMMSNNVVVAEQCLDSALNILPEHALLCLSYAQLKLNQYHYNTAVEYADKAVKLYTGKNVSFLATAAQVIMQAEQPSVAVSVYQRILQLEPDNHQFMYQLALCYFYLNKVADAVAMLSKVLAKKRANPGALHLRSALKSYSVASNNIQELEQLVATDCAQEPMVYYALAKELEDIGEYNKSFAVLTKGAALMRAKVNYNEADELASIQGIMAATQHMSFPAQSNEKGGPIFIVGMPRSGTTLVERILAQHDDVKSIGEFSLFPQLLSSMAQEYLLQHPDKVTNLHEAALQLDFPALGRRYLAASQELAEGKRFYIDKLPVNFLYCGFIKKALPNATIIHLSRDAMDSCYAIFKTLFINAYAFSYTLDELARYYATYKEIMAHWHNVMPEQILDVDYESLVTDAEVQVKRLTQWCGLDYQAEMLHFHNTNDVSTTASSAQVRKPIYQSSIGKWRNLEAELAPLQLILKQTGVLT